MFGMIEDETDDDQDATDQPALDLTELASLVGAKPMQQKFAEGRLLGMNQTDAAKYAGYAGDGVQLRSAGSSVARAKPVMALIALARSHGLGVSDAPGDVEELDRILWTQARRKDGGQNSIKAAIEIRRLEDLKRSSKDVEGLHDPDVTLNEIAEIDVRTALCLAKKMGVKWKPSTELNEAVQNTRREIAMEWFEEQRAIKAASLNGQAAQYHKDQTYVS